LLRARWSPRHREPSGPLAAVGLALCLLVLVIPTAQASPTPTSLRQRLERLNAQADQAVEEYLQAKLALQQTNGAIASLGRRAADGQRQLDQFKAAIGAQAADTYVNGAGAGIASVLAAGNPDAAFDRMETLSLLAQQHNQQLADLGVAEQVYQQALASLQRVQRQQAAQLDRLASRKTKVERLVDQTERLLAQLRARASQASNGVDPGLSAASAPPPPAAGLGRVAAVVRYAYAQVGKPYVWGADGPGSFDCSGLTMMAWAQAGISLPHSAAAQSTIGRRVSRAELQPGDLIYRYSPISHVALYVGNGMQVAATHTGSTVKLQDAFQGPIVAYSRPTG
jgi:peptidoglycan DL-endopeptidase CwlO